MHPLFYPGMAAACHEVVFVSIPVSAAFSYSLPALREYPGTVADPGNVPVEQFRGLLAGKDESRRIARPRLKPEPVWIRKNRNHSMLCTR